MAKAAKIDDVIKPDITSQINDVINTTESIKNSKSDAQLQKEQFKRAKGISMGPRKKFKCASIYHALYPDGYMTTYQGLVINLIFDNRVVELPEAVINYVEAKLNRKADREALKFDRFKEKRQDKLGSYEAE